MGDERERNTYIHTYIHTFCITVERRARRLVRVRRIKRARGPGRKMQARGSGQENQQAGGDRKKSAGGGYEAIHDEMDWLQRQGRQLHKQGQAVAVSMT